MEYQEYGYFREDGLEYIITDRNTPRHWYNYLYNNTYIAFASQVAFGEGFCQDDLGRRVPVLTDRCLYLVDQDSGTFHIANGLPVLDQYDYYQCLHGLGYTTIRSEKNGVGCEYTIFVPEEGNFEQWIVTVTNKRDVSLKLGTIAYCGSNTDGVYTPQGYNSQMADFYAKANAVWARTLTAFQTGTKKQGYGYMMCDTKVSGYDTRRSAFIGTYGTKEIPIALMRGGRCTNSSNYVEKCCHALEVSSHLAPGEEATICFQIGFASDMEELVALKAMLAEGMPGKLLKEVTTKRLEDIGGVMIETPDEKLNKAFNGFYKYATNMSSRWARVRHNGYRDICSDTECLASFNPEVAWERFVRIISYQYSNGYAPRTFIDGQIRPNNFSDCAVWITFTGYALVMELGDARLLDKEVLFNDGTSASVFEHMRRAVQYLYDFQGLYGLIKIWGGDWNDGMNRAGLEEKGVSVWLSIAWYRANKMFIELAMLHGEHELAAKHGQMGETMRQRIEEYGFDGKYYITAINDLGQKIGSKDSKEGKMYLNPQLWAVFSGIAPKEKLNAIMKAVDEYLETPLGTLVNKPGYTEYDPYIGNLTSQPVGTLINSGVYLHPMAWKLAVEGIMKRPDKLQMTLEKILPWNHKHAVTYGEPYILYNFYYGPESDYRTGTAGQSWRTATTGWVVKALVNFAFGLKPVLEGLKLDPCLPPDWKECAITKQFRGSSYTIRYHQGECAAVSCATDDSAAASSVASVKRIVVDGVEITGTLLPYEKGRDYLVDVYL